MWKRLTLSIAVLAAVVFLVGGATLALFTSSTGNGNNNFANGTVTLNQTASTLADVGPMAPGHSGSKTLDVTYTGNMNAWLGLLFTVNDPATGTSLRTCGSNAFSATVTAGSLSFLPNAGVQTIGQVGPNDAKTYSLSYSLPLATGNDCQGAKAQIQVSICAVQADYNTSGNGPTSWGGCGTAVSSSGLLGTFYVENRSLSFADSAPAATRIDGPIDFDWTVQPNPLASPNSQRNFMVRYTGFVTVPTSGDHFLEVIHDDGARLYVNGALLIDDWSDGPPRGVVPGQNLTAGSKVPIVLEYYRGNGVSAVLQLKWNNNDNWNLYDIPASALSH